MDKNTNFARFSNQPQINTRVVFDDNPDPTRIESSLSEPEDHTDFNVKRHSFCQLFLIYGLNVNKFENYHQAYEILGSFPDLLTDQATADDNNYISSLDIICFPE